jgi:hypothetical protein
MNLLDFFFPQNFRELDRDKRSSLGKTLLAIIIIGYISFTATIVGALIDDPHSGATISLISRSLIILDTVLYLFIFKTGATGYKARTRWLLSMSGYLFFLILALQ